MMLRFYSRKLEVPEVEPVRARSRGRSASRAFRRRQIVDAAIRSISKVGFADTTLATVAAEAGISQASLIFHFGSKEALLEETLRDLSGEYEASWREALRRAPPDPVAQICTLVASDFSPNLCSRKKIAAWQAFWGEVKARPTYLQICGERDEERFNAMAAACKALPLGDRRWEGTDAKALAGLIDALSDGLWQRMLVSFRTFKRKEALRLAFLQLKILLPAHAEAINTFGRQHLEPRSGIKKRTSGKN